MITTLYDDNNMNKPTLKIIKLGSDVGATKNMLVYECGDDMIIVDCGIGFPDSELLGVDVVIPDITYVLERRSKLKALFVTHAHEDHFGAIPYVIEDLNVKIYGNKLVLGFVKERVKDKLGKKQLDALSLQEIYPGMPEIVLGNFRVTAFGVNHSVPSGLALSINTPQGRILHIADYKIDWTPVLDKPIDLGTLARYGDEGVLCLLSDCLGVTTEGYAESEKKLQHTFDSFMENSPGRQIIITTISSNISRMYQIISAAIKNGRKVVFSGRSIEQSSRIASELGYLPFNADTYVKEDKAADLNQGTLVYIVAGCYGQQGSSLDRLSRGEHKDIKVEENSLVIFSADPNPPGVQEPVERLLHNLTLSGAEVIYSEIQENLHVSGHGLKGDITTVTAISKAKYYIPIGGTAAKMRAYTNMVRDLGRDKDHVFELLEGDTLLFNETGAIKSDPVKVEPIYIDGPKRTELSPIVVKDRGQLSTEGVFVVILPISSTGGVLPDKVDVVTRGFIYVKGSPELMDASKKFVTKILTKELAKDKDWNLIRRKLEHEVESFLYQKTGRKPLVLVHSLEV